MIEAFDQMDEADREAVLNFVIRARSESIGLQQTFDRHSRALALAVPEVAELRADLRLLVGACFTSEHAVEGISVLNPGLVPYPGGTLEQCKRGIG